MGFCRRCGDIVSGIRCKCGGTAVAPAVAWKESSDPWTKTYVSREKSPTRAPQPSVSTNVVKTNITGGASSTSPTKRFPRPLSSYSSSSSTTIGKRVTEHITASTSQLNRPPSPLKNSTVASPESDILPSLNAHSTGSLAKVYGSVLQPKESLASHSCALCGAVFPPDSTIYPEPYADTASSTRFLCRDCFTSNGGAKGHCPRCSRAVLALKSEGPFIEAAGDYWHKACFTCEGCGKNIGDSPMVDLLGKPSCPECFDSCLKRDRTPKRRGSSASLISPTRNVGGVGNPNSKSREGSPAIEELEQRLGIVKSRQSSPALEELSQRLSMLASSPLSRSPSPRRTTASPYDSPLNRPEGGFRTDLLSEIERRETRERASLLMAQRTGSNSPAPEPTTDQIEEMKRRFKKSTSNAEGSPVGSPLLVPLFRPRLRSSRSSGSLSSLPNLTASPSEPRTPDLLSDYSDAATSDSATQSSVGPDSPPRAADEEDEAFPATRLYGRGLGTRYTRSDYLEDDVIVEETNSQLNTPDNTPKHKSMSSEKTTPIITPSRVLELNSPSRLPRPRSSASLQSQTTSPSTSCAKCHKQLFSLREGGRYVTVPDEITGTPKTYHVACFTCSVCGLKFSQGAQGQAAFVKGEKGPCHVECAPPAKITIHKIPSPPSQPLPARRTHTFSKSVSSVSSSPSSPNSGTHVSSRYSRPPLSAPLMSNSNSSSGSTPRFGTMNTCPGCKKSVPQVSFGISEGERSIQGPNGTRWHVMCLVCGGKKAPTKGILRGRDERKKDEPGCGKRLDSGAKTDDNNGVFCRECWLLLPTSPASPQCSPTRTPLVPSITGSSGKVVPQYTGTTTLAKQFTGLGGGDAPLLRQLTGGGLSPTRSLSPTKQLSVLRPRPKSVIGMRSSKSVDEGRGMRLVRQMTGSKE